MIEENLVLTQLEDNQWMGKVEAGEIPDDGMGDIEIEVASAAGPEDQNP